MADLTPERLREAADTMAQLVRERIYSEIDNPETWGLDAQMIRRWAKNIEEEQAEEALRPRVHAVPDLGA